MNLLPVKEWDFQNIPPEQINVCHRWEFSRTAVLEADPDYVHKGIDPYAKYGEFAAPWPRGPFIEQDPELRKHLASNYHPQRGLHPLDYRHFFKNYDEDKPGSLFAFQIDWTHSDKNLRDCFEEWLKQNRPPDIRQNEARGPGAPARQMKEDLEALGIYRIISFHNKTSVSKLIESYPTKSNDETAWSRSKARAISTLQLFR